MYKAILAGMVIGLGGLGFLKFNGDLVGCLLLSTGLVLAKEMRFYIWTGGGKRANVNGLIGNLIGVMMIVFLGFNLDWASRSAYFMLAIGPGVKDIYTVIAQGIFAGVLLQIFIKVNDLATEWLTGILFGVVGSRLFILELMRVFLKGDDLWRGALYLLIVLFSNLIGSNLISAKRRSKNDRSVQNKRRDSENG